MALKGAIFDMDGTMIDSMHLWVNIWRDYPIARGLHPTEEDLTAMRGMMLKDMADYMIRTYHLSETRDEIIDDINRHVEEGYATDVTVKPGVIAFLDQLKAAHIPMVVASATERYLVLDTLKRLGLSDYFDGVFNARIDGSKYDAPIFLKAVHRLQEVGAQQGQDIDKDDIWVFEDTFASICGAKKAGLHVLAVYDVWADHNHDKIVDAADRYCPKGFLDLNWKDL